MLNSLKSSVDLRQHALYQWTEAHLGYPLASWEALQGDAGARRYFRLQHDNQSYLAVDSPPSGVDNPRFIALAQGLAQAGLHVPTVFAAELTQGFLLVNELSTQLYTDVLRGENANSLYTDAFNALLQLQNSQTYFAIPIDAWAVADYYAEMIDMVLWLLERHLHIQLSSLQHIALERLFTTLLENMQEQPHVCVHRDYHARNLLYCSDNNPGIIDFQDLFLGPITYDLVSLLRDAYVAWPWPQVAQWITQFYHVLAEKSVHQPYDEQQFMLWFHGMSVQRGIKVLGRFARLCHRDNKPRYLADLPRVAQYVLASTVYFPGTTVLADLLAEQVIPRLNSASPL